MKKILFFLLFLPSIAFTQHLKLTDSTFIKGQFIALYNINFDFVSPTVQRTSQLDSLVQFLISNDSLIVELGIHTGFRGSQEYNLELSQKRARSLCNYLVENSIEESRLTCIGYGENKPVIEYEDWAKLEETHSCYAYELGNRRITIMIK